MINPSIISTGKVALENEPICESGLDKPYSAFSGKEYHSWKQEIKTSHIFFYF
jgi:hypothetical protein